MPSFNSTLRLKKFSEIFIQLLIGHSSSWGDVSIDDTTAMSVDARIEVAVRSRFSFSAAPILAVRSDVTLRGVWRGWVCYPFVPILVRTSHCRGH